jgi:hypothetical protein
MIAFDVLAEILLFATASGDGSRNCAHFCDADCIPEIPFSAGVLW